MVKISDLFLVELGSLHSEGNHTPGEIPLVSASERRNGVSAYVSPREGDVIFKGNQLCVSYFGYCSYQKTPFIAKDVVSVLTPKQECSAAWLIAFCAVFNTAHKWRFGFGRKSAGRLEGLEIDESLIERIAAQVKVETPKPVALDADVLRQVVAKLRGMYGDSPTVGDVFELRQGEELSPAELTEDGAIPVVSASVKETNAVIGYVDEADAALPPRSLTVSKHVGGARVQLAKCAITSNAIGLVPLRTDWANSELIALASLIDRQAWRISYGRIYSVKRLAPLRLLDGLSEHVRQSSRDR